MFWGVEPLQMLLVPGTARVITQVITPVIPDSKIIV
jgi:hypothetical protein